MDSTQLELWSPLGWRMGREWEDEEEDGEQVDDAEAGAGV
jgi:hypothetical protein